ncbi:DUF1501 domain-containing protein [Rubinisphaera margarita]|uniref:DUF1501 domain-containing protein n=1 Tax=Rubinisphaera margarita TaxID=2909586 RepID=UPI001EE8F6D9|nr:DUF1501 domain-containing protein [Rubinisphaera margarita]MCG6156891.1 DUF1501 domain-containing protein [Rubinisphaera margarita]
MSTSIHELIQWGRRGFSRRRFLHTVSASGLAAGTLGFRDLMSLQAAELRKRHKAVIMLWMNGGPSQLETFDPKPTHENGGETSVISTAIPGVQIAEPWTGIASVLDRCAVIRSFTNKEGNHRRATYQLHTGYVPSGSVKHPSLGSNVAQQIGDENLDIPSVVSIGRADGAGAGFLGVEFDPFFINNPGQRPDNTQMPVAGDRYQRRLNLFDSLQQGFSQRGAEQVVENHNAIYGKAADLIRSPRLSAFELSGEPDSLKKKYGETQFGRGCLLARRLVEEGVSYVEVVSNGWDTHDDNFDRIANLAGQVDPATAALILDLEERGMLDDTLVVWMGEFGRTPRVNGRGGRDHFPRVFNGLMAGGGVRGGQVIGASTADGNDVLDRPVSVPDLFHSICHAIGVDPEFENMSPLGRPMKIVEGGSVVHELFS